MGKPLGFHPRVGLFCSPRGVTVIGGTGVEAAVVLSMSTDTAFPDAPAVSSDCFDECW
jgi:hypothetical protein